MKRSYLLAALAVAVLSLGLIGAYGVAQQPTTGTMAPARGATTALLDVSYIFKKHDGFKAMLGDMKARVEQAEAEVNRDRETLRRMAEQLQEFQKGSPQYKRHEEEMTELQATVAIRVQKQKKDFLEQEAKIYFTVYQQISQHVRYYAQQNGISMVLRFNGDPADINKPDTVLRDINKPVVWHAEHLDITPIILAQLNRVPMSPNTRPNPGPVGQSQTVPFNR
ncbi:MAG: OmpH family outer membrane protein [Pirellulales bacterium]|nr:OmpH family outer membrane protein [Pirellulales bacterium]